MYLLAEARIAANRQEALERKAKRRREAELNHNHVPGGHDKQCDHGQEISPEAATPEGEAPPAELNGEEAWQQENEQEEEEWDQRAEQSSERVQGPEQEEPEE